MNPIRQLFGQTAVYGLGTVVPRLLNYLLLTPFFTRVFTRAEYGVVTELYAYVVFLMIILTFGMETGFFRFVGKEKRSEGKVFGTSLISLLLSALAFVLFVGIGKQGIANLLGYGNHPEYFVWIALIVGLDVLSTIPFAWLRWQKKAGRFAAIKILGVLLNIGLNFAFLYYLPRQDHQQLNWIVQKLYQPEIGVGYVFIANLASSMLTLMLLLPGIIRARISVDIQLWKRMLYYSYPLLIAGMAGTVNEALDRVLLKHLLPVPETALEQLGVYGANYKIAVLMTLFVQMFRYASEPFYFGNAGKKGARVLFATVMKYFVIVSLIIYLLVVLHIDVFKHFIGKEFHEGLHIVPVVMFANLLLGIFFNLSIWYKLNNLTKYGAMITLMGAGITIVVNWFFIPEYGYTASAWAHLVCYASMVLVSWMIGRKYYRVPYDLKAIACYVAGAIALYLVSGWIRIEGKILENLFHTALFVGFVIIVILVERKGFVLLRPLR